MKTLLSNYWYTRCYLDYLTVIAKNNKDICPFAIMNVKHPDSYWHNKQSAKMLENWLKVGKESGCSR